MKKIIRCIFLFVLTFILAFAGCSQQQPEIQDDEYKEIVTRVKSLRSTFANQESFEITGTCGRSVETVTGELHVYIVIPYTAIKQSGAKDSNVAFYVDGSRLPNFSYYSVGAHEDLPAESKAIFLKACELYMTKAYQKSYSADEINNGLN